MKPRFDLAQMDAVEWLFVVGVDVRNGLADTYAETVARVRPPMSADERSARQLRDAVKSVAEHQDPPDSVQAAPAGELAPGSPVRDDRRDRHQEKGPGA